MRTCETPAVDLTPIFSVGVVLAVLVLVVPALGVIGLLVVLVLRRDGDDDGTRAPAIYASLVAFTLCFTLLISAVAVVSALSHLGQGGGGGPFDFLDRNDDEAWRTAVQALIVGAAAAGLLFLHARLLRWAASLDRLQAGGRVFRAYALAMCLVAVILTLASLTSGAYDVFRMLAPGVTATAERGDGLRDLAGAVTLALGSLFLFRLHYDAAGLPALAAPEPAPVAPVGPAD
jgi:hypothetical protein